MNDHCNKAYLQGFYCMDPLHLFLFLLQEYEQILNLGGHKTEIKLYCVVLNISIKNFLTLYCSVLLYSLAACMDVLLSSKLSQSRFSVYMQKGFNSNFTPFTCSRYICLCQT